MIDKQKPYDNIDAKECVGSIGEAGKDYQVMFCENAIAAPLMWALDKRTFDGKKGQLLLYRMAETHCPWCQMLFAETSPLEIRFYLLSDTYIDIKDIKEFTIKTQDDKIVTLKPTELMVGIIPNHKRLDRLIPHYRVIKQNGEYISEFYDSTSPKGMFKCQVCGDIVKGTS
jgi:hypothetical protein